MDSRFMILQMSDIGIRYTIMVPYKNICKPFRLYVAKNKLDKSITFINFFSDHYYWPIGKVLTEWSCLTELAVQSVFCTMLSTASLLFKELDERLKEMAGIPETISALQLNKWKDLWRRLVEQINNLFRPILLVISAHIIVEMTIYSFKFIVDFSLKDGMISAQNNSFSLTYYWQIWMRLLTIVFYSWDVMIRLWFEIWIAKIERLDKTRRRF